MLIFRVQKLTVDCRMLESADDTRGFLVLRGDLEQLGLKLIGQEPAWIKHEK